MNNSSSLAGAALVDGLEEAEFVCADGFFGDVEAAVDEVSAGEDSAGFWTGLSCDFSALFSEGLEAVFSGAFSGVGSTGFERLKKPVRVVVAGAGAVFSGALLSAAQPVPGDEASRAMLRVTPRALHWPRLARVRWLLIGGRQGFTYSTPLSPPVSRDNLLLVNSAFY